MNRPYKFPPLPKETEDQVAILVSQEPITDEFIEQLKNQFPELEIRHQFKHVLNKKGQSRMSYFRIIW